MLLVYQIKIPAEKIKKFSTTEINSFTQVYFTMTQPNQSALELETKEAEHETLVI